MVQGAEGECVTDSASSVPRSANEALTGEAEPECSNNDLMDGSSYISNQVQSFQNHVIDVSISGINVQDKKTTLSGKKRCLNDCHENTLHFTVRKREVANPDAPQEQVKPMDFSDIISSQVLSELRATIEMLRQDILECKLFHTLLDWVMSLHPKRYKAEHKWPADPKDYDRKLWTNRTLALVVL